MLKTIADNNGQQWIIEYGGDISRGDYDEGGNIYPPSSYTTPLVQYPQKFQRVLNRLLLKKK